jgi:hypothetical protein
VSAADAKCWSHVSSVLTAPCRECASRCAAVGGFRLTVRGSNLSPSSVVLVGGELCPIIAPSGGGGGGDGNASSGGNHTSIVCVCPPRHVAFDTAVVVQTAAFVSNALPFVWAPPVVASLSPPSLPATVTPEAPRPLLRVTGRNFGVLWPGELGPHVVTVGNATCADVTWLSDSELLCRLHEDLPVGRHAVTVAIRQQRSRREDAALPGASDADAVGVACVPQSYGRLQGEWCLPCPLGAVCEGGGEEPYAQRGFFPVSRAAFVACDPFEACLGGKNNTCRVFYEGDRCATCSRGAYR